MARKASARRKPRRPAAAGKRSAARRPPAAKARRASNANPSAIVKALSAPVKGAERRDIGHVRLEVGRAGEARVKRLIYPPGFRWSTDMKPAVGTDLCMHGHVGFLVHGEIHVEYPDGCVIEHKAPHVMAIEPGHDGWVVGTEPAIVIEFDFEGDTVRRTGMKSEHRH